MKTSSNWRKLAWLSVSGVCIVACMPGAGPAAPQAEPGPAASGGGTTGAAIAPETLKASPPPADAAATPGAATSSAPVTDSTECVGQPDPELDKESDWSKELGQRLDAQLPGLRRCSAGLASGEEALVTLRLVYAKDGLGTSQHIVSSTPNGCQIAECLKEQLASVRSPRLIIDRASYDLTLSIERGATPARVSEPSEPLAEGPASDDPTSCVDPAVARLSRASVQDVVSTRYDALTTCYAKALVRNHSLTGNVTFEFVIGQEGKVSDAQARDASLPDCPAIQCMLEQFRTLEFPAPVGRSVRVLYPINYVLEQSPITLQ